MIARDIAEFAIEILNRNDVENDYLNRICSSDESNFHVSGMVNSHNVRIWGSENPHVSEQLQRDSPKVNVWCGLMHNNWAVSLHGKKHYR
ncbi:hypothetical protein AVEN_207044-1 [Araneus ventricosus]|uniref:Uncharacterized protein n=1 Tax=Araneus ventricosus TaxID=182803 RepID=A0A4Y2JYW2_ARAVE|nr:hypothetical protein AVEN_207044-1 [Araneus ventricosus]